MSKPNSNSGGGRFTRLFRVMLFARDARNTRDAQRELLYALILRADPDKNYLCFPSYGMLAKDTLLHTVTLKRAAQGLEEAGIIKRSLRRNRSNRFYINVDLLERLATENREADKAELERDEQDEEKGSPFAAPAPELEPDQDQQPEDECEEDEVLKEEDHWPAPAR